MPPQFPPRITRSRSRQQATVETKQSDEVQERPPTSGLRAKAALGLTIGQFPEIPRLKTKTIPSRELKLLRLKQQKLRKSDGQIPVFLANHGRSSSDEPPHLTEAIAATLVFGQEAAGTAICISASGLLLTCSHCVAESSDDLDMSKAHWLLFADGCIVQAKCVAWDARRDLALLQVISAQDFTNPHISTFPHAELTSTPPKPNESLLCVGHPGSEDLEADEPGILTDYDVLHISNGRFRGLAKGQDVQDNSDIGALQHDCWTYWGHSGAPLLSDDGKLVGLHSSWDDETGMRRGVAWEAMKAFLAKHLVVD